MCADNLALTVVYVPDSGTGVSEGSETLSRRLLATKLTPCLPRAAVGNETNAWLQYDHVHSEYLLDTEARGHGVSQHADAALTPTQRRVSSPATRNTPRMNSPVAQVSAPT